MLICMAFPSTEDVYIYYVEPFKRTSVGPPRSCDSVSARNRASETIAVDTTQLASVSNPGRRTQQLQ